MVHKYNNIFLSPWAVNSLWLCLRSKRSGDCRYAWITAMVAQVSEMSQIKSPTGASHEQSTTDLFLSIPGHTSCESFMHHLVQGHLMLQVRWFYTLGKYRETNWSKTTNNKAFNKMYLPTINADILKHWAITVRVPWRCSGVTWRMEEKVRLIFRTGGLFDPFAVARQDWCTAFMHH